MARPSVTPDDVRAALAQFRRQGISDPGVHRIRAALGRGSVTTIAKLKQAVRQAEAAQLDPNPRRPLPDPIAEHAAALWQELLQATEAVEQELEAQARSTVESMGKTVEAARVERDAALRAQRETQDALRRAEEAIERLKTQLAERDAALAHLQGRLAAGEDLIQALRERDTDLKRHLAQAGTQAARREQELKADLDRERAQVLEAQHQAARQRQDLEAQIGALRDQLAGQHEYFERMLGNSEAARRQLESERGTAQDALRELQTAHGALRTGAEQLRVQVAAREQALAALRAEVQALERERDAVQAQAREQAAQHERLMGELMARLEALLPHQITPDKARKPKGKPQRT